jgi:hypothetical protein
MRGVTYDRLAQALGERDTELLINALGGQRLYFPVGGPTAAMVEALGEEAARRINARLCGDRVAIPVTLPLTPRARKLYAAGASPSHVARELRCTLRYAEMLR